MPKFEYVAKSPGGDIVQDTIKAANAHAVRAYLKDKGLITLDVTELRRKSFIDRLPIIGKSVSGKELLIFTKYFSILVKAGIPVMRSMKILEDQTENPYFRTCLAEISATVMGGESLARAFEEFPDIFPMAYRNLIKIGEESGALHEVLTRLHYNLSKAMKLKGKVKGALMYPAVITLVAISVVSFLLILIIPKFVKIFERSGSALPWITSMVVGASNLLVKRWYVVIGGVGGSVIALKFTYGTAAGRLFIDRLILFPPVLGPLLIKYSVASFASNLDMMSRGGATIVASLRLAISTIENAAIQKSLGQVIKEVEAGMTLSDALDQTKMLPNLVIQMVAVGEETGALNDMLETISDFYEDEIDANVSIMLSLIEPMFILFLGGVVGTIVVAMYLPIFAMSKAVTKH